MEEEAAAKRAQEEELERLAAIEAEKEAQRLKEEEEKLLKEQMEKKKKDLLIKIEAAPVDDHFANMARRSTRARQSTFRMGQQSTRNMKKQDEAEDDPFSQRFNDMIKDGGLPSRKATHSKKVGFSMH